MASRTTGHPEEYTITHIAGGAMLTEMFHVDLLQFLLRPDLDIYFRNKKEQKQNNQLISNQLSQTNIVLSKINFKCELLCSYCLHNL
jgi:uncharacterized membrane protein YcgQ (UPF0703/DUF1980 family)